MAIYQFFLHVSGKKFQKQAKIYAKKNKVTKVLNKEFSSYAPTNFIGWCTNHGKKHI